MKFSRIFKSHVIAAMLIFLLLFSSCDHATMPETEDKDAKSPVTSNSQNDPQHDEFLQSIDDLLGGQDAKEPAEQETESPVPSPAPEETTTSKETITPKEPPATTSDPEPTPAPKFELDPAKVSSVRFTVHGGPITQDVSQNKAAIDAFIAKTKETLTSAKQIDVPALPKASVTLEFNDAEGTLLLTLTLTTNHLLIYEFQGKPKYAFKITAPDFIELEAIAPTPDRLGYRISFPKVDLTAFDTVDVDGVVRTITRPEMEAIMSKMEQECTAARESSGAVAQMTTCLKLYSSKEPSKYFYIRLYGDNRGICHLQWNTPGTTEYALIRQDKYRMLIDYFKTVQYPQLTEIPNWQQYN